MENLFCQKSFEEYNIIKAVDNVKTVTSVKAQTDALARLLLAKDEYTFCHSQNVAALSVKIAETLGIDENRRRDIFTAAYLHDIGKIGIEDFILKKEGRLTEDEYTKMKTHTVLGDRILSSVPELCGVAGIVRSHHERYDGTGYPDGLSADRIPLESRIIAIADAYDAITTRKYCHVRNQTEAIHEIRRSIGSQFDSEIANEFITSLL